MEFSVDFFRDEIRDGFYVPTQIKQAWAAGMDVLDAVRTVCDKHGIRYFAACGTLMGCARHGGFVPWDDDLDIGMCREDYRKFREVADAELPEGYVIHDYERKEDHWLFLARVVNREKICFEPEYLNSHRNFPWLTGVDIFLFDYLYDDEEKEKERDDEILHLMVVADAIVEGRLSEEAKEHWFQEFETRYGITLNRTLDARHIGIELYRLAEAQMSRIGRGDSHTMQRIFPMVLRTHRGFPARFFEQLIRLPYEHISMPVPSGYHTSLATDYGDYYKLYKQGGAHCYPYYEGQRQELIEQVGLTVPEYSYAPKTQRREATDEAYRASLKGMAEACLERIDSLYRELQAADVFTEEEYHILEESQQLAADLGTLIEAVKGEASASSQSTVAALQAYCDGLYAVAEAAYAEADAGQDLGTAVRREVEALGERRLELRRAIEDGLMRRREVLFLSTGAALWGGFCTLYEQERESGAEVSVVALPICFKDCYGRIKRDDGIPAESEEEFPGVDTSGYPEGVSVSDWMSYDVSLHFPDRVYIQDAYDGENPVLSIPPRFYASRIRDHCRELVLVPALLPEEFAAGSRKEMYNMRAYVTVPGVVYADRVLLPAEWLRERYIEKLCSWAGEESRSCWEGKLELLPPVEALKTKAAAEEKRILYMIGLDGMALNGEAFLTEINNQLRAFEENPEIDKVAVAYYPPKWEEWTRISAELAENIRQTVDEHRQKGRCSLAEAPYRAEDYSAYYGSAAPAALAFRLAGKKVELSGHL